MNVIELDGVVKRYQQHTAVDHVSFAVPAGKTFGLLGPNGAGKTSIIRIITAITKADEGTITFNGTALNASHREEIGYMPEERGLYKKMKVADQVMYLARLKGLSKQEAKIRMNHWFGKFDIDSWRTKKVQELSKGMQQKIQFITTVIHEPKLLILDEPFSGLDPVNTNLIRDEIDQLRKAGTTILFSTHRMEQVEQICEEIVLINKGQNVLSGLMKGIKKQFKENLYSFDFEGTLPSNLNARADVSIIEQSNERLVVQLAENANPNDFLRHLLDSNLHIIAFEEILPSLNEIFIRIVKGKSNE